MCILAFSSFTSLISALPHIREESIWHVACVVRWKNEKDTNTQIALILCHTCMVICFHNSATSVHLRAPSFYLCHVYDQSSQEKNRRHLASQSPTRACWKRTRKMSVSSSIKHRVNFRLHICLCSTNRLADSWPCRILLLMAIIS